MNLVLLEAGELDGARAVVGGRRARHIALIHRASEGKRLRVGVVGGRVGSGVIVSADPQRVVLDVELDSEPPAPLACMLVLALPRPRVLRRVLGAAATFGIKRIVLLGAQLVEKSYWQSPTVADEAIRDALVLGLEQGCDTVLPVVDKRRRFRPFVEDELAALAAGSLALLADPGAGEPCPAAGAASVTLVIGPESGFVDFELELLHAAGLRSVSLGTRPLRVEHAFAALIGRLF